MEIPKNLSNFLWLLYSLTLRELKGKYKSASLGFIWAFVNPFVQMIVLIIVFSFFFKIQVENYPLFILSGILPWTFFATVLSSGTSSLINSRDLIKKNYFKREAIPLASVLAGLVQFVVSIIIFLLLAKLLGFNFSGNLLFLPIAIIFETLLLCGLVLFTSSLDIYFRDVGFIVQAITIVWFYLTPVFYPLSFVPEKYLFLYKLNPMVGITSFFRFLFLGSNYLSLDSLFISIAEICLLLFLGFWLFKKRERYFADWI